MKAAVFHKPYRELQVEEWPTPTPGPRDVLVKVSACGVCHTDLHYIDHGIPPMAEPPLILGHEIAGIVEETGSEVTGITPGQRVLIPVVIPCGKCKFCSIGKTNLCRDRMVPGNKIHGGYAEYFLTPDRGIILLPDEIPLTEAAIISDAFGTGYNALVNIAALQSDETLLVFGCGGLGSAAIQIAKQIGAHVIGLDMNPLKLDLAESMGADEVVNSNGIKDLGGYVRDMSNEGVDVVYEAIGAPRTIYQSFTCLGPAGRLVVAGYTRQDVRIPGSKLIIEERSVHGVLGCPISVYKTIIAHVQNGDYKLSPIVTKQMPLDDIEHALTSVRSGQTLRTVIIP